MPADIQTAMKKQLIFFIGSLCASLLLSCSTDAIETRDMNSLNSTASLTTAADITAADLVGTWRIYAMNSDVEVNFNQDTTASKDILAETDCFNQMYFTFNPDGVVHTTQARLYFNAEGDFSCSEKNYAATYQVINQNELKINFIVNGTAYSEVKTITITNNGENEFLNISLTSLETDAAVYVAKDPGNTTASKIEKIDFVYIKD